MAWYLVAMIGGIILLGYLTAFAGTQHEHRSHRNTQQVRTVERLQPEVALLALRTEQLRIHLRSIPRTSTEARKVYTVLLAMKLKITTLRRFSRAAGVAGRGRVTLH